VVELDILTPAQFALLQKKPLEKEQRLLLAMLEDAVHCFQTYLFAKKPRERQLFAEAEAWINSTQEDWFFSFENTCELLGLQATALRDALNKWRTDQLLRQVSAPHERRPQAIG
jgi:hypothetical protein